MKGQTDLVRNLVGVAQQGDGDIRQAAELAGKLTGGAALGHAEAYDDRQIGGDLGFFQDLVQLFEGVDDEVAHAVIEIGLADGFAALDRVHEGQMGGGEQPTHQLDLVQRGDVEMADAGGPKALQDIRIGIGFNGIQAGAGEMLEKLGGALGQRFGVHALHRLVRAQGLNHIFERVANRLRPASRASANFFGDELTPAAIAPVSGSASL